LEHIDSQTARLTVLTPGGESVRLGSLWSARPLLLVLVRHYGCVFCREQVADLQRILSEHARLDVGVAVLGNGTPPMAEAFIEATGLDVPLYTNPDREVYRALGARRPSAKAWLDPRVWLNGLRATLRGHFQRRTQGDAAQLGGVFLILRDGSLPYAYRSVRAGDHPANAEVLRAVHALSAVARP
jgi:peroxiredoxin